MLDTPRLIESYEFSIGILPPDMLHEELMRIYWNFIGSIIFIILGVLLVIVSIWSYKKGNEIKRNHTKNIKFKKKLTN